ncbi:MAG TPA: aromatic amino acid lyase, partial [Thermoanaerobaculia bacterium]|nr:aromatic amino acid lyase [Thermoanaerobaculia bacterium]
MTRTLLLDGESLTLDALAEIAGGRVAVRLADSARAKVEASRQVVERLIAERKTVYGVTTGFGVFSEVRISAEKAKELQENLILSHCAGVGEPHAPEVSRAMMALRINALAKGYSGIRADVIDLLIRLLDEGISPVIPSQGSVGASGDLAPLAHLAAVLMGEGEVWEESRRIPSAKVFSDRGIAPVVFEAKEGLAMINGTQAICAVGGLALQRAGVLVEQADAFAAMTLDALQGTDAAFDPRIHLARPHQGQRISAERMRTWLAGSEIREGHRTCAKVQDAYSLRCIPQVHGAVRDALAFAREKLEIEINSATDNPLIFVEGDEVLSGGNFHGAPVALACDVAAIALT